MACSCRSRKLPARPDQSVVYYTADRLYADRAVSGRRDRHRVRFPAALSELHDRGHDRGQPRFLPHRIAGCRLVGAVGSRHRGALAERQARRNGRERRARLLQPGRARRRPEATADHAGLAAPRRRQDRRRDQDRAVRATANSRSRPGRDRPADAGHDREPRQHRQFRIRSAAGSGATSPPTCRWCWRSFAASLRRGAGRRRPTAPS